MRQGTIQNVNISRLMMAVLVKRNKNKNWNMSESTILVDRCVEGYSLLFGSHSPSNTEEKKGSFWKETLEMINAVGPGRTLQEAKKKMGRPEKFHKGKRKKMKKEVGQTGGGPAPDRLTPLEEKVLTVIPKVSIEGLTADGDVFTENLKESSIEQEIMTAELETEFSCTHNENKMMPQSTDSNTQPEVASPSCSSVLQNRKRKAETTNTTCQACRNSITQTQEEMLIASKERNSILKNIEKHLEELVSLKK